MYTCMHTDTYTYIHSIHTCTYTHTHTRTPTHPHTHIWKDVCINTCVHTRICVYTCIYIQIYIYMLPHNVYRVIFGKCIFPYIVSMFKSICIISGVRKPREQQVQAPQQGLVPTRSGDRSLRKCRSDNRVASDALTIVMPFNDSSPA